MEKNKQNYIRKLIQELESVKYVPPGNIPNIELYMDQVTTFMDKHLECLKRYDEDKLLTKTMINNYTKNNLLPSPNKKKYSKDHMFILIFIYYMKSFMSITDIQHLLHPLCEKFFGEDSEVPLETIYQEVFEQVEEQAEYVTKDVVRKFERSMETFETIDGEDGELLRMFTFISMICFDIYMKKQLLERLIDQHFQPEPEEKGSKEKKGK